MSWDFTSGGYGTADFGSGDTFEPGTDGITLGCFIKYGTDGHPGLNGYMMNIGHTSGPLHNESYVVRSSDTDAYFQFAWVDNVPTYADSVTNIQNGANAFDNQWTAMIAVVQGDITSSSVYKRMMCDTRLPNNADQNSWANYSGLRYFALNELIGYSTGGANVKYAEVAIWDTELTGDQIDDYMGRVLKADSIQTANLKAYWPLDTNDSSPQGSYGPELTLNSGVYSPDHPAYSSTSATVNLYSKAGSDQASLSSLSWAWFDTFPTTTSIAATDAGTTESTDGNGQLVLSIPNSTLTSGQTGWLLLYDSTGTKVGAYTVAVD